MWKQWGKFCTESVSGRIMLYAKKDKEAADLPTIWMVEGRFMLDCGLKTWRRRWEEVYKYEVVHWKTVRGTRLNLDQKHPLPASES